MSIFNVYKSLLLFFCITTLFSLQAEKLALEQESPVRHEALLNFWFGKLEGPEHFPENKMEIWLSESNESEREFIDLFLPDFLNAMKGECNHWRDSPRGRLALIILLDQFPRHAFKNKPQAFMADAMARGLVLEGLQKGDDRLFYPVERAFFYLPLEHAESKDLQLLSIQLYKNLFLEAPLLIKPEMQDFFRFAMIHKEQIDRFGRFPHRNAVLGRNSTPEEIVFLNLWSEK